MKQLHPKAVWLFFVSYILRGVIFWLVLIYIFSSVVIGLSETTRKSFWWFFGFVILFLVLYFIFAYVWARLSYRFYRYELTEDSFKTEKGVIYKTYVTLPYERIQNVDIYRGIMARLLGLSDIHIQTAGISYAGKYGRSSEGRLPGLSRQDAEQLRDELIRRAKQSKNQGL